jgi:hypothetical protein
MHSRVKLLRNLVSAVLAAGALFGNVSFAQVEMFEALKKARNLIEFRIGDDPLTAHSVLTTTNPSRGAGSDGTMMLWLDQGRPLAAVSVYNWEGKIMHEIDSLARVAGVSGTSPKGKLWKASFPGVKFKPLVESSLPMETAENRRLLQMKEFAKQFQVTMLGFNDQNSDREQLRMLATPVYRYSLDGKRTRHTEVADGAVFAFVQGSDPEALLVIEGIKNDKHVDWEYAIVRATAGGLQAKRESEVVFSAEKFPVNTDPSKPHYTFEHTVAEVLGR